jgi:hypothetical protein
VLGEAQLPMVELAGEQPVVFGVDAVCDRVD